MERITIKKKVDRLIIKHKIEKTEQVSNMEFDIINKREIAALLPVQFHKGVFGKELRFIVQDYQDLRSFFKSGISFEVFLKVIIQVVQTLQDCESYGIRCGNLELNSDLIFFDYKSQQVRMLYWPLISITTSPNIAAFFLELGSIYVSQSGDQNYRLKYLNLFDSRAKFELDDFLRQLDQLLKNWKEKDDTGVSRKVVPHTGGIGVTVGLRTSSIQRVKTNEAIEITKYPFTLGRLPEYCDLAFPANSHISKRHVTIFIRNNQYYIRDNSSTNGTRMNGKPIPANVDMELSSGDSFVIGGEEFIFRAAGVC